jgi:hypothetical protein
MILYDMMIDGDKIMMVLGNHACKSKSKLARVGMATAQGRILPPRFRPRLTEPPLPPNPVGHNLSTCSISFYLCWVSMLRRIN